MLDGLTLRYNSPISKFPSKPPKNDFSNNGTCEMKVKLKKEQCQLLVVRRISVTWRLSRTRLREELTNPQFSVCGGAVVHEMGMVPQRICPPPRTEQQHWRGEQRETPRAGRPGWAGYAISSLHQPCQKSKGGPVLQMPNLGHWTSESGGNFFS